MCLISAYTHVQLEPNNLIQRNMVAFSQLSSSGGTCLPLSLCTDTLLMMRIGLLRQSTHSLVVLLHWLLTSRNSVRLAMDIYPW